MEYTEQYEGIYFNPLPPYGGRPQVFGSCQISCSISIHSLRMEGDQGIVRRPDFFLLFQSTPSVWRETYSSDRQTEQSIISIHSLRMEGDLPAHVVRFRIPYFNPLPPYGGRPHRFFHRIFPQAAFQSTPSVWRETFQMVGVLRNGKFQSTPSVWRETYNDSEEPLSGAFQSTPSVWRETCHRCFKFCNLCNFNPLPPYGGRL